MMSEKDGTARKSQEDPVHKIEQEILQAIRGISYGSVEVIVHNSKIAQIQRKEKVRFDQDAAPRSS